MIEMDDDERPRLELDGKVYMTPAGHDRLTKSSTN